MARVLVVDDEPSIRTVLALALTHEGHTVAEAGDGAAAMAHVELGREVDLVLLDLHLGDASGLDLIPRLKRDVDLPVIVVSGRDQEVDRVVALRLGADDYVTKPFSVAELMARVGAVLRRAQPVRARLTTLEFGPLVIDPEERLVTLGGGPVPTTNLEFNLLLHLARSPLKVFSREALIRDIWRSSPGWQSLNTVTEHVRRLRRKLHDVGDGVPAAWIETVRGTGYRFVPPTGRSGVV
ncbi:MAG TPA: response regulator transcription factor [Acidimicrobiales bacterium]|nr:response regulator transcription factor [Acidimicrobiales bacterium]